MDKKMKIYEGFRAVPNEAKKNFNNGKFSGTDINPMWRIKRMTEQFGACGFGWYVEIVKRELVTASTGETAAFIGVNLYIKDEQGEWSKPIYGEGGNLFEKVLKNGGVSVSDEAYKMAYTDAISNACKMLGLGADVWFESDKTKYTEEREVSNKIDPKEPVFRFLAGNADANQHYLRLYNCMTMDDFTSEQLYAIYNELKKHKRI